MKPIVFIHGAFLGGWCWSRVVKERALSSFTLYRPTLTGLGEKDHLLAQSSGLICHIQDIEQLLYFEDLHDTTIVAHSYGGAVACGVLASAPERIARVIFVDAFLPINARPVLAQFPPLRRAEILTSFSSPELNWRWQMKDARDELKAWGIESQEDLQWTLLRIRPQSIKTLTERPPEEWQTRSERVDKTYIYCTEGKKPEGSYHGSEVFARNEKTWNYLEVPTRHAPMITHPKLLGDVIRQCIVD